MQVKGSSSAATSPVGDDAGFTVVELSIVMAIALLIMSSLMGLLVSQSNASVRIERFVDDQEEVRRTFVALQRDLRSAEAILPLPAGADAGRRVDLEVYLDPAASESTVVRWQITDAGELVREQVTADGGVVVTWSLEGVESVAGGLPLLQYYGANDERAYSPATSATAIVNCAVRVGISLRAAPTGTAKVHLVSDVHLRNRIVEGRAC